MNSRTSAAGDRNIRFVLMSKNRDPLSRLAPALDSEQRLRLHQLLLLYQISQCALCLYRISPPPSGAAWPIALWSTPEPEHQPVLLEALVAFGVRQFEQGRGHLGIRMSEALLDERWPEPVGDQLLLGIDSVDCDARRLSECLDALERRPWAFVPSRDGGFFAAAWRPSARDGGRRPSMPDKAFSARHWSHARVLDDVLARLREGEGGCLAPVADIDNPEDLAKAARDGSLLRAAYQALRCGLATPATGSSRKLIAGLDDERIDSLSDSGIRARLAAIPAGSLAPLIQSLLTGELG